MTRWSLRAGLSVVAAAVVLAVVVLDLGGQEDRSSVIAALVLSTGLGPDGRPLPPPVPMARMVQRPVVCTGAACGQADPATKTMMDNIKKVLHALDNRLGNIKNAESDWKSSMHHNLRMIGQQVGSIGDEEKKVLYLKEDVTAQLANPGPAGAAGMNGLPGPHGFNGAQGPMGSTGPRGIEGVQGKQGIPGILGAPGIRYLYLPKTVPAAPFVADSCCSLNLARFYLFRRCATDRRVFGRRCAVV